MSELFEKYTEIDPRGSGHSWLRHRNCRSDRPCVICDGGLSVCTVCNGAEGELTMLCCGRPMTAQERADVLSGRRDYTASGWFCVGVDGPRPEDV